MARVHVVEVVGRVQPRRLDVVDGEFYIWRHPRRLDRAEVDAFDAGAGVGFAHWRAAEASSSLVSGYTSGVEDGRKARVWGLGGSSLSTAHAPVPVPRSRQFCGLGPDGGEVQLFVHGGDGDCVFHVFSVCAAWSGVGDSSEHRHIIMQMK